MKKNITTVLLLFTLIVTAQNELVKISFNKAVNISGKQRMLSQKMAKAYIYLLENPTSKKTKKELLTSKIIFEKHNEILKKYSTSKKTTNKLKEVDKIWSKMKNIFEGVPNISDGKKVVQINSILLTKADDVVKSIILDADAVNENIELKNIINISGKQRMLSQRLALYYFANTSDLNNSKTNNNLENTYNKFENAISTLLVSHFNNLNIDKVLSEAMRDWDEFKKHKKEFLTHKMSSKEVLDRTNNLTNTFNKLTALYEKIKAN